LNGRDVLQLATTTPTVIAGLKTPSSNPGNGEGFIGAGTREIQNGLSLDGISIMSNLITEATFHPNVDAVQEVQVQTERIPRSTADIWVCRSMPRRRVAQTACMAAY